MSLLKSPGAVTVGEFADGPDIMLWNPAITEKRWRRCVRHACLARVISIRFVAGLLAVASVVGIDHAKTIAGALTIGGAIALVLSGLIDMVVAATCLAIDHQHRYGRRCRLERSPGEFFLRSHDFIDLGEAAVQTAGLLIELTGELHDTAARDWLNPELPGRVHQVVWDALSRLSRTGGARRHAACLAETPGESDLAATTASAIAEFDASLGELVFHLQGCVTLTRAWEAKLRHAALIERTSTICSELELASIHRVADAAAELPPSVFAHVTAARDLTGAGPFPWEPQRPEPVR
ncbi:hypothetical protein ACGFMK_35150 [Amycolatopsis sp. NPDC049252]|uniref:hypothetical protein n=1 Tax=Amycolatopsis sp. NPDC049252 TaxID=3363933 RepID=UPI003721854F